MKYYTALLDTTAPDGLHITHKYLGEQSPEKLAEITTMLDEFFQMSGPVTPVREVLFNQPTFFGPHHDIPVLLPAAGTEAVAFRPALRTMLDKFNKDAWDNYRPHVTTREKSVRFQINFYALMHKSTIVKVWPLVYTN